MMMNLMRRVARSTAATHLTHEKRNVAALSTARPASSVATLFSKQTAARRQQTPVYHANDVTGVVAGVAAVGALIGVAKMWWDATSSGSSGAVRGAAPPRGVTDISRDDIAQFFVDLKLAIEQLFKQLPEIDAAFREHLKSQNVELGEEEYKRTLLQQLFDVLQNIEQQVVGQRGWDHEAFAHAMEKFADDEEIVRLQAELQTVMQSVFPQPDIPEHLTPEKILEILRVVVKGMEQAMAETLKHARAEGITDPTKAMEEFQQIYLEQVEQITFQEMKKHDVTGELFNFVMQKYHAENASFRKEVEEIYAHQAESFRRMGLSVDDKP